MTRDLGTDSRTRFDVFDFEPRLYRVGRFEIVLVYLLVDTSHSRRSTTVDNSAPVRTNSSAFCRCRFHSSPAFSASPALIMSSTIRWVLADRRTACWWAGPFVG